MRQHSVNIPAHLNENGIGGSPDPFFRRARKMRSGDETLFLEAIKGSPPPFFFLFFSLSSV